MPAPNICIECDKPALLLLVGIPYCVKHYKEEKDREETNDGL